MHLVDPGGTEDGNKFHGYFSLLRERWLPGRRRDFPREFEDEDVFLDGRGEVPLPADGRAPR